MTGLGRARLPALVLGSLVLGTLIFQPWKGPLGQHPEIGMLSLYYAASSFLTEGLHPTLLNYPDGGWWWPAALPEALLLAPFTSLLGAGVSWNLLWMVRLAVGVWGAARWLEGRGIRAELALLWAFWPGTWLLAESGAAEAGAILYLPFVLTLLERPALRGKLLAGLLLGGSPGLLAGTLSTLAILEPGRLKDRSLWPAWALAAVLVAGRAWTLLAAGSLRPSVGAALLGGAQGAHGAASLEGALWGWGSPLLLALVLASAKKADRRPALLGLVGLLLALGPTLRWAGQDLVLAQKPFPLPLLLVRILPPVSVAEHLSGFAALAALGALLLLGRRPRAEWVVLGLLPVQLYLCLPTHTDLPVAEAGGPAFFLPLPRDLAPAHALAARGAPVSVGLESLAPAALLARVTQPSWQLSELQGALSRAGYAQLRTDATATWGQGPELGWLLGSVAAVDGVAWPAVGLQKQTLKEWSTVPVLPPEATRPRAEDWTAVEGGLEAFFDRTLGKRAMTEVWLYEWEGEAWRPIRWIAHSLTSLGLGQSPNGALVLTGMVSLPPELGPSFPLFSSSSVVTLATLDLERWGARTWWLADRLSLVDSHVTWENGEPVLYSWIRTGALGVDPVSLTGDHPVIRATMGDDGVFHAGPPVWSAAGLADPSPAQDLLYATEFIQGRVPSVRIARREGSRYVPVGELPGITVPYVWEEGGEHHLLAHGPGAEGRLMPVQARSADGVTWTRPEPVPGFTDVSACESPVATVFQGRRLLLCSRRLRDARSVENAPPGSGQ
ncbi:MAG: hypothetical protein Q8P18_30540 [Pseudomonadota bacterium]|nr:hypothetical protein [Pseudomonadota bacterium]